MSPIICNCRVRHVPVEVTCVLREIHRSHRALLTTLAPSTHPWIRKVYLAAKARYDVLLAELDRLGAQHD